MATKNRPTQSKKNPWTTMQIMTKTLIKARSVCPKEFKFRYWINDLLNEALDRFSNGAD